MSCCSVSDTAINLYNDQTIVEEIAPDADRPLYAAGRQPDQADVYQIQRKGLFYSEAGTECSGEEKPLSKPVSGVRNPPVEFSKLY